MAQGGKRQGAGRRAKPTHLHLVQGTRSRVAQKGKSEPKPKAKLPPCPKALSKVAKAEFKFIGTKLIELGLMGDTDGAALAGYAASYARFQECEDMINKTSPVMRASGKHQFQINPWIRVQQIAARQMLSFLIEFGLSPSSRARLAVDIGASKQGDNPWRGRQAKNKG